jgi:hypothetical protein
MKKLLYLIIAAAVIQVSVTGCKKDKTEEPAPQSSSTASQETISKKWMVGANSGRLSHATEYLWFEFNKSGQYIIAKTTLPNYISGNYTISADKKTITLQNYGVITITSVSADKFNFTITLSGSSTPITIFSTVSNTAPVSSTNSDKLCRTWKVDKITMTNFLDSVTVETYPNGSVSQYDIIITKYGTYFISYADTAQTQYHSRMWQWKDSNQTILCYGDSTSECNGGNEAQILANTATSLQVIEYKTSFIKSIKYELTAK